MNRLPLCLAAAFTLILFLGCSDAATPQAEPSLPAVEPPSVEMPGGSIELTALTQTATPEPQPEPQAEPAKARKVVVLDPGHGGDEVGAARYGVVEKDSNLDFALRVERLLLARGVDVVLTRRTDARAAGQIAGYTPTRSDLQARLDLANAVRGDVLVSIHSNGSEDAGQKGVEAWYDSNRAFAEEGKRLAGLLVRRVVEGLRLYGYAAADRGLFDGRCYRQREGRCFSLFVIGGARETSREDVMRRGGDPDLLGFGDQPVIFSRPANMPAALVELLIISNSNDAAVLRDAAGRQAIAAGVARAILEFLGIGDGGS